MGKIKRRNEKYLDFVVKNLWKLFFWFNKLIVFMLYSKII